MIKYCLDKRKLLRYQWQKRRLTTRYKTWFHIFAVLWMLYSFLCVTHRLLNFCADVSEYSVCSIFIGRLNKKTYEAKTECSEMSPQTK